VAEIRKHNPQASDIARQVRELMGETIRPRTPGEDYARVEERGDEGRPASSAGTPSSAGTRDSGAGVTEGSGDFDPFDSGESPAPRQVGYTFSAASGPLIGLLPEGFTPWLPPED
jgi:hypothetical protein